MQNIDNKVVIIYNAAHHVLLFKKELINSIKKSGYQIIVLASSDRYVEDLKLIVDKFYYIKLDSSGINPFKDIFLTYQIFTLLKKIKPFVILNFTIKPVLYGTLAAKLAGGIPVVNTITGLGTAFINDGIINKIAKILYKYTFNFSHLIFFQNPDDKEFFKKINILKKDNTKLISGSGVDLEKFKPVKKINTNNFKILFIGRIIADKGIYELIQAAKTLKKDYSNLTFVLMGMLGVKNRTSISEDEVNHWINTGLINYIPFKDDVRRVIADSDLVVLPSYREGTPKSLLEAASMAKPIVASDVPGCREVVVHGKNGYLCQVKNSESLAKEIKKFIELDFSSKIQMGLKSREIAEKKFDVTKVNNNYIELLNTLKNAK